ncbi:MAG: DUF6596 domain-containing protein, partial [Myxococcota bacterium]
GAPSGYAPRIMSFSGVVRAPAVARSSYGKLLAILVKQTGDVAQAEDALGDAFQRALETWPTQGVPPNPEGWLIVTARNRNLDRRKSAAVRRSVPLEAAEHTTAAVDDLDPDSIPDERLRLLFLCAHPAIDASVHTPLMLQTVLGLNAEQIAEILLVPSATVSQRLVRAKRKIKAARIPFELPARSEMRSRLDAVLEAIYGSYSAGWLDATRESISESVFLVDVLSTLMPDEAEVLGLQALIDFSVARRDARLSPSGDFVPLDEQDPSRWSRRRIERGLSTLARAREMKRIGRFQLEAAIQSVHCERAFSRDTDWPAVVTLYDALVRLYPSRGAQVARAAALGQAMGAKAGLHALLMLPEAERVDYQPALVTEAHLRGRLGEKDRAVELFNDAVAATKDLRIARYLERVRNELG